MLVNSNPATIMTDPEFADRTYIEPVTPEFVELIIERERPDALLPTMGGQTALNVAMALSRVRRAREVRRRADRRECARDRDRRRPQAVRRGDAADRTRVSPPGGIAESYDEAEAAARHRPASRRSSARRSRSAGRAAASRTTARSSSTIVKRGLDQSPTHAGAHRAERARVEGVRARGDARPRRQRRDRLLDREPRSDGRAHRRLDHRRAGDDADRSRVSADARRRDRDHSRSRRRCRRMQHPVRGQSARRRDARDRDEPARVAVVGAGVEGDGFSDRAHRREARRRLPPRRDPERHHEDDAGVVRAGARLRRGEGAALRVREISVGEPVSHDADEVRRRVDGDRAHVQGSVPEGAARARDRPHGWTTASRLQDDRLPDDTPESLRAALRSRRPSASSRSSARFERGLSIDEIYELTAIDPWFLAQMRELVDAEQEYAALDDVDAATTRRMKRMGFSDRSSARCAARAKRKCAERRWAQGVRPAYKMVDTCAGEFPSATPYLYGCYDEESEAPRTEQKSVVILGSGPNRIGQGVEFDYCCVRAAIALRERGFETIMINSNPETVSTDFDTSDKLYFEPLTLEDVLEIVEREQPMGVIVQLGGQTPLKLTRALEAAGVTILGTSPGLDRRRRRPPALRPDRARARTRAAAERHGDESSTKRSRDRRADRLSRARAAVVRARRPRDADRVRRDVAREYFARAVRVSEERPGADRPLSRGRVRVRRRRDLRRHARRDRRHHAAHRGRGHPLRRLGLRAAAVSHRRVGHADHARADGRARDGARSRRPDQRAVRDQGRRRSTCSR